MLDLASAITEEEAAGLVQRFPYHNPVFLLPPWQEIYGTDSSETRPSRSPWRYSKG